MDLPCSVTAGELATANHPVGKCLQDEPGNSWGRGGGGGYGPQMGDRGMNRSEVTVFCPRFACCYLKICC